MKISIVIPSLNAADTIGLQLEALAKQCWPDPWEVIVSDNGSTDNTLSVVNAYVSSVPNLRILEASQKRGAAHAMNRGASIARGQFLIFCDADDEVASDWLAAMARALSSYDVVASRMEFRKLNTPWMADNLSDHPQTRGLQTLWYPPYLKHAGACGLGIRRSLHEAIAGFDESLLQVMDTDYCLRIQQEGIALHFASDALVHIRCRSTALASFKQLRVWGEYNMLIFKRYRQSGDYEWWLWKTHLRSWKKILRTMPSLRSSQGRAEWFRMLGWQIGILKGSIKHMVPPVPIP